MALPVFIVHGHRKALGYQQITNLSSAVSLAPRSALSALIQAETSSVRWRDDGTAPTNNVGMLLTVNSALDYDGDLGAIQFIDATANGVLNITYYGEEQIH
jgi:hypothetical protein